MGLCFSSKMTKIEHLYFWLFLQVDDAEEPNKTGENKAPSKFQSIGVQVEEEKWWVHMHLSPFVLMLASMVHVFFPYEKPSRFSVISH